AGGGAAALRCVAIAGSVSLRRQLLFCLFCASPSPLSIAGSWGYSTRDPSPPSPPMSCRAAPWGRPSAPRSRPFPASARLRGPFGGLNAWKNPILKNSFGLPSGLFRCMASSGSGDGGFSRPQSIDEAPMPLYSWPDKKRPRVCILGGGFGGLYTALRLESLVWPGNNKPQVK
uniref:FAD/NAD(P)-binding domain-containing protein n=1 Tax=Aegilops tauschii subsp. strangulata TaxID=200361 RepID=A0A453R3Q0_AEGTS